MKRTIALSNIYIPNKQISVYTYISKHYINIKAIYNGYSTATLTVSLKNIFNKRKKKNENKNSQLKRKNQSTV